jgi:hypothetical protein
MLPRNKKAIAQRIDQLYGHLRAAGASGFTTKAECIAHAKGYASAFFRLPSLDGWHSLSIPQLLSYRCELEQLLSIQLFTYYIDAYRNETLTDLARAHRIERENKLMAS